MGRLEAHPTISIIFLWGGLGGLPRVNNIILILFQRIYLTGDKIQNTQKYCRDFPWNVSTRIYQSQFTNKFHLKFALNYKDNVLGNQF